MSTPLSNRTPEVTCSLHTPPPPSQRRRPTLRGLSFPTLANSKLSFVSSTNCYSNKNVNVRKTCNKVKKVIKNKPHGHWTYQEEHSVDGVDAWPLCCTPDTELNNIECQL